VIDLLTHENRCVGALAYINGVQHHLGEAHDPRQRRGGAAVPRIDQPAHRHRRRPRDGVSRRRGDAGHGDGAVPPDDALRRRAQPRADHRSRPRRRGVPRRPHGPAIHVRLSQGRRARAARLSSAAAIVEQIRKTHFSHVFLDARHLAPAEFRERFPQLAKLVDEFEIESVEGPDPDPSGGRTK
jgi:hypothetical protein